MRGAGRIVATAGTTLAMLAALLLGGGAAANAAKAPNGFMGMNAETVYAEADDAAQNAMLDRMKAAGVTLVRQSFRWGYTETAKNVYDWAKLDRLVAAAAWHGMRVLPLVYGETRWATSRPAGQNAEQYDRCTYPPKNNQDYADFARNIALRYGKNGQFWKDNPSVRYEPVTAYELWNEPNLKRFWKCAPNAAEYVAMARPAANAIRAVDPKATIISAGAPKKSVDTGKYFNGMFKAGAREVFNAVGFHSYEPHSYDTVDELHEIRDALNDKKVKNWTLWLTEWGWATAGPPSEHTLSEKNQATAITNLLKSVAKDRKKLKLSAVAYYAWQDAGPAPDSDDYWGNHTGLLRANGSPKPSFDAFSKGALGF